MTTELTPEAREALGKAYAFLMHRRHERLARAPQPTPESATQASPRMAAAPHAVIPDEASDEDAA